VQKSLRELDIFYFVQNIVSFSFITTECGSSWI